MCPELALKALVRRLGSHAVGSQTEGVRTSSARTLAAIGATAFFVTWILLMTSHELRERLDVALKQSNDEISPPQSRGYPFKRVYERKACSEGVVGFRRTVR